MKKLLFTMILLISYGILYSQPIIPLGNSRSFVKLHMEKDAVWNLESESRLHLTYSCDTMAIEVTYRFTKDSPSRIYSTCTETSIHFKSEIDMSEYLSEKLSNCRLKPDDSGMSYTIVTDLYDDPIHVYAIGKSTILIKY